MKQLWKHINTVYTFPDGRKETHTFCLTFNPENQEANAIIMLASALDAEKMWKLGAVKSQMTCEIRE
jgi:hypothetical protein